MIAIVGNVRLRSSVMASRFIINNNHSFKNAKAIQPIVRFVTASAKPQETAWQRFNTRFRRVGLFLRYTRIPFLVVSVYSVGYQQGVIGKEEHTHAYCCCACCCAYCSERMQVPYAIAGRASILHALVSSSPWNCASLSRVSYLSGTFSFVF